MTFGCGTRGFLSVTRSIQTQTKPFSLPLLRTEKAKWFGASSVSGSESAMRRTSACVAISARLDRSSHLDEDAVAVQAIGNSLFRIGVGVGDENLDTPLAVAQSDRSPYDAGQRHK